jgi:hypothetical protein
MKSRKLKRRRGLRGRQRDPGAGGMSDEEESGRSHPMLVTEMRRIGQGRQRSFVVALASGDECHVDYRNKCK